jgi:hypothetical protein
MGSGELSRSSCPPEMRRSSSVCGAEVTIDAFYEHSRIKQYPWASPHNVETSP